MKILSASQIRAADQYTIEHEPIRSIDLMERASDAFVDKFIELVPEKKPVVVFCGIGNNGGDGLAIGRILAFKGWEVSFYIVGDTAKGSSDFKINFDKCSEYSTIRSTSDFPRLSDQVLVIDALFGSGLSRPLEGVYLELVNFLNDSKNDVFTVDVASGLFCDQPLPSNASAIKPEYTISFQLPKLVFFLPEYHQYVGEWYMVDIGLDASFIESQESQYYFSDASSFSNLLPTRQKFAHKSSVGKVYLAAGSKGKVGAAGLAAQAAFRTGAGVVTIHTPACATSTLTTLVPEGMIEEDAHTDHITEIKGSFNTVGIGPGIGTHAETQKALEKFLAEQDNPVVLDADALNLISLNPALLGRIPEESILTPHPGEFRRLVGDLNNDFEKLEKLKDLCRKYHLNVVLKGAYSAVCDRNGYIYFNSSGNPGMATAGSGDVLTGIVTSLLAQQVKPFEALLLGTYIHGRAGDLAAEDLGESSLMATDIISKISNVLRHICVS